MYCAGISETFENHFVDYVMPFCLHWYSQMFLEETLNP